MIPSKTFCTAPWYATYYKDSVKKYKMCCVFDEWTSADSPEDYYNTPIVQDVRAKMLKGEWHSGCSQCEYQEKNGISSDRHTFNGMYEKEIADGVDTEKFTLKWLDYRPGNLCNLKCRMCHPSNSSLIDKETQANPELQQFMGRKAYPENKDLLPSIANHDTFKDLEVLKILGGEPTIDPQIQTLLNWVIENGYAKNINLRFTTNVTNMNPKWVTAVNKFKTSKIQISLDGTGPTFNYIRTGANWGKIKENTLKCPTTYNNIRNMGSNIVWSIYNCFTVDKWYPELLEMRKSIREHNIGYQFNVINCTNPDYQLVSNLPDEFRKIIIDKLDNMGINDNVTKSLRVYTKQNTSMPDQLAKNHLKRFFKHNDILDRLRKTNIDTLSPEYKQLREIANG